MGEKKQNQKRIDNLIFLAMYLLIIINLTLGIFHIKNIETIKRNPCQLCQERGGIVFYYQPKEGFYVPENLTENATQT